MAQTVKHLPAMRETQVRFRGREDPLDKEMAIHSSTLAWKIPWMEEPDRLQYMGSQRVRHDWAWAKGLRTTDFTSLKGSYAIFTHGQHDYPDTAPQEVPLMMPSCPRPGILISSQGFWCLTCRSVRHYFPSVMSDSFATPWTVAHQVPLSMGFSRQECWSGLPFPCPGDLPDPGIEPGSPALQADALPSEPSGKLRTLLYLGVVRHMLLNLYWELRKTVGSLMADNRMSLGLM